jgi:hypothetical protein
MANSKSTGKKAPKSKRARGAAPKGPVSHSPGRGLMVSTQARFPQSADDKIVVAKSIIQAVVAAHDAGAMDGENYDIHWPLSMAIDLLEQASGQLDVNHG